MASYFQNIADSPRFHAFITGVIVANAAVIGLETSRGVMAAYGPLLTAANAVFLVIFIAEILVRLLAYGSRPQRFFQDGWNIFDFTIVAASMLPEVGAFTTVARLARLMRVTRLISVHPELRLIVSVMVRSIPSMGHVVLLLCLLLYVYGILGYHLFGPHDPQHWGTLWRSLLTLFQILTLEGWVEIQAASLQAVPWAWIYYSSFVVIAVFVVINLFIAVVINNLEAAKTEHQAQADAHNPEHALLSRIEAMKQVLDEMERALRHVRPEEGFVLGSPVEGHTAAAEAAPHSGRIEDEIPGR